MDIAGRKPDKAVAGPRHRDGRPRRTGSSTVPPQLSGGQQQRVAVARALASKPEIIFGDEPTGNLDSRSGAEVLGFLRNSVRELGQTVVMVTHDPVAASYADRVVFLADGRIVDDMHEPDRRRRARPHEGLRRQGPHELTPDAATRRPAPRPPPHTATPHAPRPAALPARGAAVRIRRLPTPPGLTPCSVPPCATSSRTRPGC